MAIEEVGARLVAQGEAQYVASMKRAQDATNGVTKAAEQGGKTAEKSTSGWKKVNDLFKQTTGISLGMAGAIGIGVVAIKGLADYMGNAVQAASSMNETLSKSNVVFGDSADAIERMGNKAAEAMGMSKQEAIEAAATYGNLFTSMGLGQSISADMSAALIQLTADLASFNNASPADTLEAIRSGLVGETEPLRRFGINLSDAALKQEALNLGLKAGKEPLDAATKAQAAYSLMLKQSTNAQGDFARTADGAANQQRTLEAKNKDVAASIGKGLLPAYVKLLKVGNDVLTWLDNLINRNQKIIDQADQLEKGVRENSGSYESYVTQLKDAVKAQDLSIDANGNLIETVVTLRDEYGNTLETQDRVIEANYAMSEATWDAIQMEKEWGNEADRGAGKALKLAGSVDDIAVSAEAAAKALDEKLKASLEGLKAAVEGPVGKAFDDFTTKQMDLIQKINALSIQIGVLEGKKYLTEDQKKTLGDLRKELGGAQTDLANLSTQFEDTSKRMAYDMLVTKAASDGLTQQELDNLGKIAVAWGIMDQKTVDAMTAVNGINLDQADLEVDDFWRRIMGIPETKTVNLNVVTTYTGAGAVTGGGFIPNPPPAPKPYTPPKPKAKMQAIGGPAYAGSPYWVGEEGPEPFIPNVDGWILSNERAQAAVVAALTRPVQAPAGAFGRSVNYYNTYGPVDNSKHFDLGVSTTQSPQVVQRSFAMMKLLEG